MATYKVSSPDLDGCNSFDVYLSMLKVWEATTPVEWAKWEFRVQLSCQIAMRGRRRRNLSDKFKEPARDVVLAMERCLGLMMKWL